MDGISITRRCHPALEAEQARPLGEVAVDPARVHITIYAALSIAKTSFPDAYTGLAYSTALSGAGGKPPYVWAVGSPRASSCASTPPSANRGAR